MELYSDIDALKSKYIKYTNGMLDKICDTYGEEKVGDDIRLKIPHGLSMCDSVRNSTLNSGFFNETYGQSAGVDGLLHDIGRFKQYLLSRTLNDEESKKYTKFNDHGQYGEYLLSINGNELLRYFLGNETRYDHILKEVVGQHTNTTNPNYIFSIESLKDIFTNYELLEVLNSQDEQIKNKLIALKLLILKEQDSLEILQKVRDKLWMPRISSEEEHYIKDEVWKKFLNLEYINMAELKQDGSWTPNAGFLLRYSLIYNNINFVGTLKTLLEDGTIDKIYMSQISNITNSQGLVVNDAKHTDPRLKQANEYIKEVIKTLIETSPDEKTITSESREIAKRELTKIM